MWSRGTSYTVIGGGGIGGTVAAGLLRSGADVTLIEADERRLAAIRERGLTVEAASGRFTAPVPVAAPDEVDGLGQVVLLAVKSRDTEAAMGWAARLLPAEGVVVSLQNGLNELAIAGAVGASRTLGALVDFAAASVEPGHIELLVAGEVVIGELTGPVSGRLTRLADDLGLAFPVSTTDNIWGHLWSKVAFASIMFMNVVSGLRQSKAIGDHPDLAAALATELCEVAQREGVRLCPVDCLEPDLLLPGARTSRDGLLAMLERVRRRVGPTPMTGMWRDIVLLGRPTEVDQVIGTALGIGRRHGLPCPLNSAMVAMVHEIERRERAMSPGNLVELDRLRVLPG